MAPLLPALLLSLLSCPVAAQAWPETATSKKAVADFKVFTDELRVKAPGPLYDGGKPGYEKDLDFDTPGFKKSFGEYRELFLWTEDNGPDDGLTPERFAMAYAKNSKDGEDDKAGLKWTCDLVSAMRGYFSYYSQSKGRLAQTLVLHGTQAGAVDFVSPIGQAIAKRYKEITGTDISKIVSYDLSSRCYQEGEPLLPEKKEKIVPPKKIVKDCSNATPYKEEEVDFTKYDYYAFYYDAAFQSWQEIGSRSKNWKPTPEDFKKFVLCRAPEWVGCYISRVAKIKHTPKGGQEKLVAGAAKTYGYRGPGEVLRHPDQPEKAQERDRKLIAEYKKKYCPKH